MLKAKDLIDIIDINKNVVKFFRVPKKDIGISPYDLVFRGEKKTETVEFTLFNFDADNLLEENPKSIEETLKYKNKNSVTWLNIDGIHNPEIMESIALGYDIDKMMLADVMNTSARPRVFENDTCMFISIKMLQQNSEKDPVEVENLSLIFSEKFILSFQEKKGDVFEPIRERIRKQKKRIRTNGTDYLAFALLDIVIDNYLYAISTLGDKIEAQEERLISQPRQSTIDAIYKRKRELNFIRRNIKPAREMILTLAKMESDFIDENNDLHFQELVANINQASDASDNYREMLSDQLNIYHTTISSKLNDIMKFLTVFSVIFIPLTFIAGIYGTNFDVLPELHYKYSYYIMLGVMLLVAVFMLIYFKRKKWF
ncbi:MAG: magnesium/cobalt transporter CorA [Flavobacteriales bacterium]|nr:magnesium/cobalt transporter CorA [Flavobacteriales bacterium]